MTAATTTILPAAQLTDVQYLQQQLDAMNQRLMELERRAMIYQPQQPTYSPGWTQQPQPHTQPPYEITC